MKDNEKIRKKFEDVSDIKLIKKTERVRFLFNIVLFVAFFVIFYILVMLIGALEEYKTLYSILTILIIPGIIALMVGLDALSKKIKFPSEIEQKYRIEHPTKVIGHQNIEGVKEFKVDKSKKKKISRKNITSTIGGKIAIIFIILLTLIMIFLPLYVQINREYIKETLEKDNHLARQLPILRTEEYNETRNLFFTVIDLMGPIPIFVIFLIIVIVTIICVYRQRTKLTDMRINEKLKTDGKILVYQFNMVKNRWYPANGVTLVTIDLENTKAIYDKNVKRIIFYGNVKTQLIINKDEPGKTLDMTVLYPFDRQIQPKEDGTAPDFVPDGTEKDGYFEIYDYFTPSLAEFLELE